MASFSWWSGRALALAVMLVTSPAVGLDKQGSSHGGSIAGEEEGFAVGGAVSLGSSLYNPSFASRPDNSGLVFLRYALHLDVDLIGRRLSVPLDLNMFTDWKRSGAGKLAPSEFDVMSGLTSTWPVSSFAAVELGSRFQHERPVDRGKFSQTFIDTRARLLYEVGRLGGWFTLGWFTYNDRTYAARPDLTGVAFLRYAVNARVALWRDVLSVGVDATMFTDRDSAKLRPSELDLTPELVVRVRPMEVHLAYERDLPVDRRGLVQQFVYLLVSWEFDPLGGTKEPLEERNNVVSP